MNYADYENLARDCAKHLVAPGVFEKLESDSEGFDSFCKVLAGFLHVSFKCSVDWQEDTGHFKWNSANGVMERAAPVINNTHLFDGDGVQNQEWLKS